VHVENSLVISNFEEKKQGNTQKENSATLVSSAFLSRGCTLTI
jgi:hypothetical protein